MKNNRLAIINKNSFFKGFLHSFVVLGIASIIFGIVYFLFLQALGVYPIFVFIFMMGGVFILISGLIGPGRYYEKRDLIIIKPSKGSSYFEYVPLSAISIDDHSEVQVIINDKIVTNIDFKDGISQKQIPRDKIDVRVINNLILKAGDSFSNLVEFTFFEFDESLSDEDFAEFGSFDKNLNVREVYLKREEHIKNMGSNQGSYSIGILLFGCLILLLGLFQ